jgi:hypothetical protein
VVRRIVYLPDGEKSLQSTPRKDYAHYLDAYSARELEEQTLNNPNEEQNPPRALEDIVIRLNGKTEAVGPVQPCLDRRRVPPTVQRRDSL